MKTICLLKTCSRKLKKCLQKCKPFLFWLLSNVNFKFLLTRPKSFFVQLQSMTNFKSVFSAIQSLLHALVRYQKMILTISLSIKRLKNIFIVGDKMRDIIDCRRRRTIKSYFIYARTITLNFFVHNKERRLNESFDLFIYLKKNSFLIETKYNFNFKFFRIYIHI